MIYEAANYSIRNQVKAYRTMAVIIIKTTIEPKRTKISLMKGANLIFVIFVVLYTMEIVAISGSNHNMDWESTPILTGCVKLARI